MINFDESDIIKIIQSKLGNKKFVSEDVETFDFKKIKLVAKTDTLVESTDIPPKMRLGDAARKSIVACVSDFASKGIRPKYGMISINLPKTISNAKIKEIATGFRNACQEYNILISGGDTNEGKEIVFNVCIFGNSNDNIVKRRGAKKGDAIFVTGPFGYTTVGLKIILGKYKGKGKFSKKALKSVTRPNTRLEFGIKNKKYFSSSMDSSDGLSTTLNEMSKQSNKKFIINHIPAANGLQIIAKSQKWNLIDLVFHGGEEYEFVFTVSQKDKQRIKKNAKLLKIPIIEIGHVTTGNGVFIHHENNNMICLKDLGWKHFR
ncbi:MAG: thiamine-phosphate kinase [Nitrosopumilus sp.]